MQTASVHLIRNQETVIAPHAKQESQRKNVLDFFFSIFYGHDFPYADRRYEFDTELNIELNSNKQTLLACNYDQPLKCYVIRINVTTR